MPHKGENDIGTLVTLLLSSSFNNKMHYKYKNTSKFQATECCLKLRGIHVFVN